MRFPGYRTALLGVTLTLLKTTGLVGQTVDIKTVDIKTAEKVMPLWTGAAPEAQGTEAIDVPTMTVFLPPSNPTGAAVVIFPGGGYAGLSMDKEGAAPARWLNAHGVAAVVVKYRLGMKYHHPAEMHDGQRAIRTVRSHAKEWGIDPGKIGVWGFSAGGHMAATMGTQFDLGAPDAKDEIDRVSCRPDFMILAYPVITLEDPLAHKGSRINLLGADADPKLVHAMSAENRVTKDTPPAFLFATFDDRTVPVLNSVLMYTAMVKAGVPAEMHLYEHGPHGVGLAASFPQLKGWPDVLADWMRGNGWMASAVPAVQPAP